MLVEDICLASGGPHSDLGSLEMQADIYSFGVVLWELATGEAPQRGQLRDVKVPEECPMVCRSLLFSCGHTHHSMYDSCSTTGGDRAASLGGGHL